MQKGRALRSLRLLRASSGKNLLELAGFYWSLLEFTGACSDLLGFGWPSANPPAPPKTKKKKKKKNGTPTAGDGGLLTPLAQAPHGRAELSELGQLYNTL